MKKFATSPFFTPIIFPLTWLVWVSFLFVMSANNLPYLLEEHGILEKTTNFAYIPLLLAYVFFAKFFLTGSRDKKIDFVLFVLLGIAAFLRELGIQHWLASKDSTAFKSRFFLNPENPLSEKIVAGLILLTLLIVIVYLAIKYSKHLVVSFFKLNPTTWSIATLCTVGIVGKFVDRFPSNYKKSTGVSLPEDIDVALEILEETSETFLPIIAAFILLQYWLIQKNRQN